VSDGGVGTWEVDARDLSQYTKNDIHVIGHSCYFGITSHQNISFYLFTSSSSLLKTKNVYHENSLSPYCLGCIKASIVCRKSSVKYSSHSHIPPSISPNMQLTSIVVVALFGFSVAAPTLEAAGDATSIRLEVCSFTFVLHFDLTTCPGSDR